MRPVNGHFDSTVKGVDAQSPVFEDTVVTVPHEIVTRRVVVWTTGSPRATVHLFDGPIVSDNADDG